MISKNKIDDKDLETTLNAAWQNWRQEIQIYWQRALYFFGFISVTCAGYIKIKTASPEAPMLSFLLSIMMTFLAFAWYLSNRGSKFWQENWELHIKKLEKIPLMSDMLYKQIDNKKLLSSYPCSPYKINTLISFVVFLFCLVCVLCEVCSMLEISVCSSKWATILAIPFIYFMIKMPKILKFRKFK